MTRRDRSDVEWQRASTMNRSTQDSFDDPALAEAPGLLLTILHHPDGRRVGECVASVLTEGVPTELSRLTPKFHRRSSGSARALAHPRLSREPIWLRVKERSVTITPSRKDIKVTVDQRAIHGRHEVTRSSIREHGVVLGLGGCVLLYLHESTGDEPSLPDNSQDDSWDADGAERQAGYLLAGLAGISPATRTLGRAVRRVAPLEGPVFLRAEGGVDTESVARSIHRLSGRADEPWVSLDLSEVPAALMAARLFGDSKAGGDVERDAGCFVRAHRGTLFLNDISRLSRELQARIAQVIAHGQVNTRDGQTRPVSVRLIATTTDDVQELVAAGRMQPRLAHRLQEMVAEVPPLRACRADMVLLFHRFVRAELARFDAASVLDRPDNRSRKPEWLRVSLLVDLMRYSLPGNVAELRNIARYVATYHHDRPCASLPPMIAERVADVPPVAAVESTAEQRWDAPRTPDTPPHTDRRGKPAERDALSDEMVRATLRQNRWNIARAARALGVARNTLTYRMRNLPGVQLASELSREDIVGARRTHGDDVQALAEALEVSAHGLRLRLRELGLD